MKSVNTPMNAKEADQPSPSAHTKDVSAVLHPFKSK